MIRCSFRFFSTYSCNILGLNSRNMFRKVISPESSRNSYIIIPEIANNTNNINLENILSISTYDSFIEFSRTIHNFETELSILLEKLNVCATENLTFENSVLELEKIIRLVDIKFKCLKLIYNLKGDPTFDIIFNNLHKKTVISNQEILLMPSINYIFDILNKSNLNNFQKVYINSLLLNLKIYGHGLPTDKIEKLHNNLQSLMKSQMSFCKSVHKSTENVVQLVNEADMSKHTPLWLMSKLKIEKSGNLLRIDLKNKQIISEFLKFCNNHEIRNQIWLVRRQFGGKILFDTASSNYNNILDIRKHCKDIANIFGEKSYCDFIFNSDRRMAKSLDEVLHVLQQFKNNLQPNAEYEYRHAVEYARKEKGLKDSLMLCDYDYIHTCFSLEVKKCPWAIIQNGSYTFDIQTFFSRLFSVLQQLFDISFSEISFDRNKVVYSISNSSNNEIIGKIIFLINRNRGNGFIDVIPINDNGGTPISLVAINLLNEDPHLINGLEIVACVGNILDGIYNNVNFEISPLYSGRTPDSVSITAKFLLDSVISSKHIFKYLFSELDPKCADDLSGAYLSKNHVYINDVSMMEMLSSAYFDLEMWLSDKDWKDVQTEIWSNFFSKESELYFPLDKFDEWPCGATEVFANQLWCGVHLYSGFWTDHVVKLIMNHFIKERFYEWNPNEQMNPELSKLFLRFKKLFIEDHFSCKAKALNIFLTET